MTDLTPTQLESFDRWYEPYPKKVARKAAEKAWAAIDQDKYDAIIADCEVRAKRHTGWKVAKKHIPNPASFLNGERWNDEIISAEAKGPSAPRYQQPPPPDAGIPPLGRAANRILLNAIRFYNGVSDEILAKLLEQKKLMLNHYTAMDKDDYTPDQFLHAFKRAYHRIITG